MLETISIYEVIAGLLLLDSALAILITFTRLGDNGIEQLSFVRRYLPLTKGWALIYFTLALYISYLTFFVL